MAFCCFSKDGAMFDSTPIENMFLLEYLPTAPEGFLRVYLYARMLCVHPELGDSLEDMARALRMDEDAVFNALSYWEQQGLAERLTDRPPTYALTPLRAGDGGAADHDYYTYREYNSSLQEMFGAADLLEPKQYKLANDWLNVLGLSQDAALRLLEYERSRPGGKKPASVFKRADKRAVEWADRGIRTLAQVEKAIEYEDHIGSLCRQVMQRLGLRRAPSLDEIESVRRWVDAWHLSEGEILAACEETTKSRQPSIGYLDAILKNRADRGSTESGSFRAVKELLRELGAVNAQPTPAQVQSYEGMLARGFEPEAISLAAVQCARKNRHSFEELEWMLGKWAEKGVRTRQEAEQYVSDMQQTAARVRVLLEKAGVARRPTLGDLETYAGWKDRYSAEMIDCAAELSRGARAPVPYMEKLLSEWEKAGIRDAASARAARMARTPEARSPVPEALNYQQHVYTEQDFGPDFFYDPSKDDAGEDDSL